MFTRQRMMAFLCFLFGMVPVWGLAQAPSAELVQAKSLSKAFRQAAEQVRPAVVTLKVQMKPEATQRALRELLADPRLEPLLPEGLDPDDWTPGAEPLIPGLNLHVGSGVIVDASGVVLTNHHVVQDADEVTIRLADGTEMPAQSIVSDPLSDLAIVRFAPPQPLSIAKLGDSELMNIGDWVIAIGSPFELEATVSAGIISAKERGIEKIQRGRLLQTDAAINPGNSGGPLVNLDGEVVGINTAIATSSGGYQGVGFAIPANRAQWVWRELVDYGQVRRAYLGIKIDQLDAPAAKRFGCSPRSAVWVRGVTAAGSAAQAGMQEDDLVLEFAGTVVRMPRDLQDVVEQTAVDTQQPVKILRDGEVLTLHVTLRRATP